MFRDTAAGVNARTSSPPTPIDTPPPVNPAHRWRCPACRRLYAHPWLLAIHLTARDEDPTRPGHGMAELDAWTTVATLMPVDVAAEPTAAGVARASGMTPVRKRRLQPAR